MYKTAYCCAAAVLAVLVLATPPARAGTNPFKHEDPRWQVQAAGGYAVLTGYDGKVRRGGSAGLSALAQLTSAFSISLEARWHAFAALPVDSRPAQAVGFQLMVRYDLDVLDVRPYLAAGGTAMIFPAGHMRDAEVGPDAPAGAVGWNIGPVIELGLDWRPIPLFVVGIQLDMGWLLRFTPPGGNPWPQMRTISARLGAYF
jgi:hypothetical protein